ncbi:cobalamin biosynthesis protein, partial [Pseudomonas cichorii]
MSVALLSVAGVALDALLGEPKRSHPLVAFGRLADRIEQRFNSGGRGWRSHGVTAWFLAVVPLTLLATILSWLPYVGWLVEILALYCALGLRSLG